VHYRVKEPIRYPTLGFALLTTSGTRVFNTRPDDHSPEIASLIPTGMIDISVSGVTLAPGGYVCNLAISDRTAMSVTMFSKCHVFEVDPGEGLPRARSYDQSCGVIYPVTSWKLR